jgi:hypothetical protein
MHGATIKVRNGDVACFCNGGSKQVVTRIKNFKNAFFWDETSEWKTETKCSTETVAVGYLSPKLHAAVSNGNHHENFGCHKILVSRRFGGAASGAG